MGEKGKEALSFFFKSLTRTLFLVGAGILFASAISAFITPDIVRVFRDGVSEVLGIMAATLVGFAMPGPRYVLYPVFVELYRAGLGPAILVAFISGHVLVEPATFLIEMGFFGWRFPVKRLVVSFVVTVLAGLLTILVYRYAGWRIL
jgi:uncharacterized membrane protein YraQ (UPF0718 family)